MFANLFLSDMVVAISGAHPLARSTSVTPRASPARLATARWHELALQAEEWARPCQLDRTLLEQRTLKYDLQTFDFIGAAQEMLLGDELHASLAELHLEPIRPPAATAPALRRAQIQAQLGGRVSKTERKAARTHAHRFERSVGWRRFLEVYQRYIAEWVVPQFGGVPLLYQRKPILRVVLPGSVAPTKPHCDTEYFHDANELNFWVPLTAVSGANSLWSESAPGAADYAAFEAGPGEAVRFYGNRCRHYTTANDAHGRTRVSFDFRVIPHHLFRPPSAIASTLSRHELNPGVSKKGYYALADPTGLLMVADPAAVGEMRRRWRETSERRLGE